MRWTWASQWGERHCRTCPEPQNAEMLFGFPFRPRQSMSTQGDGRRWSSLPKHTMLKSDWPCFARSQSRQRDTPLKCPCLMGCP